MKEIIIKVNKTGKITVEAEGFTGTGCVVPVETLGQEFGGKVEEAEHKAEFYLAEEERQEVKANGA